ncbi:fibronectin type III domain-containing protein [Herbihabitans rhizosphaerae]|uniref:fibronectin type III domain-containing protein n=1 Tax=Herbihabitans rhizosphaerae TaxID=1872711 RepID=UPI00102CF133|nr:fibronectin type III domain-containing protein [Herbihabitans rhizosphaerae]
MSERRNRKVVPLGLFAIVCAGALVAALTGATAPLSAARFALSGHWVFNSDLGLAFHVNGATTDIDAQVAVAGERGSQVVQGESNAYVVGPRSITEFNTATHEAGAAIAPPADEMPVGVEAVGGPYLVYRNAGKVVRLGAAPVTVSTGGPVGDPVVTSNGTLWLHRTGSGAICALAPGATELSSCPVSAPKDHAGALTVIGDKPVFVDLFTGLAHTADGDTLGAGAPLGVPVSPNSRAARHDVDGRVAIFDPERHSVVLADLSATPAKPVTIVVPGGEYDGPVSTGSAVVLVERQHGTVLSFGADGSRKATRSVKRTGGQPRLTRGEDKRVYVEDAAGTQIVVVGTDGSLRDAPVRPRSTPQPTTVAVPDPRAETPPTQTSEEPARPPGAPAAVSAVAGDGAATVSWGPPPADDRAPISSYRVSWRGASGAGGSLVVSGGARQTAINGLVNGVRYVITVAAVNRAGAGPGVAAPGVTPVSAAAAPVPNVKYFNGSAVLTWAGTDLRGGTLVHYLVTATGFPDRTVTTDGTVYSGLASGRTVTFTVRAVTTTAGRTLTGAPGSTSFTVPGPSIAISRGRATTSDRCHAPDCAFVNATFTGLAPNTQYGAQLSSTSTTNVVTEDFTTDANGSATYNKLNYDVPGETVWVSVATPSGRVSSNRIYWEPR